MNEFIINGVFWVLALYGLIEIIKTIVNSFTYINLRDEKFYVVIAVKDGEERVEGYIRSFLSKIGYDKNDILTNIIIVGLESEDKTKEILDKLEKEYINIAFTNWTECKRIIENM